MSQFSKFNETRSYTTDRLHRFVLQVMPERGAELWPNGLGFDYQGFEFGVRLPQEPAMWCRRVDIQYTIDGEIVCGMGNSVAECLANYDE